uniref:Uncharacterized protein n=1 Tax=Rhizophora mucronata TaxID=61149 RepID=A0A2P2NDI4_RHIMU
MKKRKPTAILLDMETKSPYVPK